MALQRAEPGRPRDRDLDARILKAALRQLSEDGYSRMSIDSIAAEAGTTKPALYRRWNSKADLATAAISELRIAEPPLPEGSPLDRLHASLRSFRSSLLRPRGMALIGVVLAEEGHTPDLLRLFRQRIVEPRRTQISGILDEARAAGLLKPEADRDAAVNLLIGSFYARYLEGVPIPAKWIERIVAVVWRGIAKDSRRKPAPRGDVRNSSCV
ncbi:MAG: TetR/AcrR family transcriptional regulator [Bryobacteraceae bacterium]